MKTGLFALISLCASLVQAADYPAPVEGDYAMRDFKFAAGETLPELNIHYRTIGKPAKNGQGQTAMTYWGGRVGSHLYVLTF